MTIYDKVVWHVDAGEEELEVVEKFKVMFSFLEKMNMLNADGQEIAEEGVDDSVSLHDELLNDMGKKFMDEHYDNDFLPLSAEELSRKLKEAYSF